MNANMNEMGMNAMGMAGMNSMGIGGIAHAMNSMPGGGMGMSAMGNMGMGGPGSSMNPMMGMGGAGSMNPSMGMNMGMGGMSMGRGGASGISPAQLMGAMGGGAGGMNSMNSMSGGGGMNMSPSQLLQQQQHQRDREHQMQAMQQSHQQRGAMGAGMNSINSMNNMGAMGGGMGMGGFGGGGNGMNSMNSLGGVGGGMNNMGSGGGGGYSNMGMGGINPSALASSPTSSSPSMMGSPGHGMGGADPIPRPGTGMSMSNSMSGMSGMPGGLGGMVGPHHPSNQHTQQHSPQHSNGHQQGAGGNVYPSSHGGPGQNQSSNAMHPPGSGGPSHPSHPSHPSQHSSSGAPGGAMNPLAILHNLPQAQFAQMLNAMNVPTEKWSTMAPQEKQAVLTKMAWHVSRQQLQQQQNQQNANTGVGQGGQQQSQPQSGAQGQGQGQQGQNTSLQPGQPGPGGNYYDREAQQARAAELQVRAINAGGAGPGGPASADGSAGQQQQGHLGQRPGSSAGDNMMGGAGAGMMPPPPRPPTAMSMGPRSSIGMGMSGTPANMGNMGNMSGMNMGGGMPNMPGNMPNMGMTMSRPGTAMGIRSGNMMGMPNMPRHPSGSHPPPRSSGARTPGPGSPGGGSMRPPSRAMSVSSVGGGDTGVNGYPVPPGTPKHPQQGPPGMQAPGTPQMGHGMPALGPHAHQSSQQHLQAGPHQGSPPPPTPTIPAQGGPGSPNPAGPGTGAPGTPYTRDRSASVSTPGMPQGGPAGAGGMGTPSGRGTPVPNMLKRKASGMESPRMLNMSLSGGGMGPPSGVSAHGPGPTPVTGTGVVAPVMQNGRPMSSGGMSGNMNIGNSMGRPGTASGVLPMPNSAPGVVGGNIQTPAQALAQSQAQIQGPQGQGQIPHLPQTQRQTSLPPPAGSPQKDGGLGIGMGPMGVNMPGGMSTPTRMESMPPMGTPGPGAVNTATPVPPVTATAQAAAGHLPSAGTGAASQQQQSQAQAQQAPVVVPQLPPLPAGVKLNPAVTHVQPVPLVGSDKTIPLLTPEEIEDIKKWQKIDTSYEGLYKTMREKMEVELRGDPRADPRDIMSLLDAGEFGSIGGKGGLFGKVGLKWWEKGALSVNPGARFRRGREVFDIRYPGRGRRDGQSHHGRGKKGARREGLRIPRRLTNEEASRPEQLVPIRLEFDVEHHKMRDTFVWNLNDPVVTPEDFAQSVVDDYQLAPSYHAVIVKSIQDQLSDYKAHSPLYDGEGGEYQDDEQSSYIERGNLDEESAAWWEAWRKRLRTEYGFVKTGKNSGKGRRKRKVSIKEERPEDGDVEDHDVPVPLANEKPMTVEEFELDEQQMAEEMRILIKLDIIVGSMKLDDQFEWDLDNLTASPERFAEIYTQDLGLGGEFRTAIAHSIREQVQTYQKSLFLVGHPSDGTPIQDEDLRSAFLPSLVEGARSMDQVQSFTPLLNYLSDGELDRNEKERDKDINRRRKRNTRGRRGVNLPDREPIRTYRTPAIGFPELDAATLALAAAASAPMSRRAAAAAASLTIANMVASENGTPFMPQTLPTAPQPPPTVVKEKKPKGLFKAPPVPPSVLRPRAQITGSTPTTAADVSTLPAPLENDPPPSISAPDSRLSKVITAKRAKELEREAKEKEFADGQHANYIDGVWHCSNCGCPESIAIGRRKGPLGDKSQCGTCGKFWHRHRRPRPCEYNTDPDFHSNIKRETDIAKTFAKKKGGAAALRAQSNTVASTPAEDRSEPQTPARRKGESEAPSRQSPPPSRADDDRAASPISTASSASEPPLAQRVKLNGIAKTATPRASPLPPPEPSKPQSEVKVKEEQEKEKSASNSIPPPSSTAQNPPVPPASPTKSWPPQWLTTAMQGTQVKYPNDKFEVVLRKVNDSNNAEWRIKCVDCPGKLYKPGPGETLSNFEVHLKNRQHRQRVDDRVGR